MKHVGKMKHNNTKVVVVYRTIPGDPYSALVVPSAALSDTYHDSLMNIVQDPSGQSAYELAELLSVRQFPDGNNMLVWLHTNGHLKKVATDSVLMTPTPQASLALDELNRLIAEQRGVPLDELCISPNTNNQKLAKVSDVKPEIIEDTNTQPNASALRSKADALFKEAQKLRKQADELDPPKKKTKEVKLEA